MDKKTKGLIIAGLAIVGGVCVYKMLTSKKNSGMSNAGGRAAGTVSRDRQGSYVFRDSRGVIHQRGFSGESWDNVGGNVATNPCVNYSACGNPRFFRCAALGCRCATMKDCQHQTSLDNTEDQVYGAAQTGGGGNRPRPTARPMTARPKVGSAAVKKVAAVQRQPRRKFGKAQIQAFRKKV
jgi:hypothetical protein